MGRLDNKFDWQVSNVKDFQARLDKLAQASKDFSIPFRLISSDFYRSQKQLFMLQSPGMYEDLAESYKPQKMKKAGFLYPILVAQTRILSASTLGPKNLYSKWSLNSQQLTIGSAVPYGKYHQSDEGRKKIPQRKFVFIDGGEGDKSKGSGINGRRERWLSIIDTHIEQLITGSI